MIAAFANSINPENPLDALSVGEIGEPHTPPDWVTVHVKSASLNHHDIWSLKGQALKADRVPMILGSDAAGVTQDGREVVVHAVIGQMHCAIRSRQHAAEVQYPQAFQDLRAHGAPLNDSRKARIGVFTASGSSAKAIWRRSFKTTALAP